ncbi:MULTISPECIES: MFS transporter [Streptomyces]|uniref:MFS transporter n=1 Tax=Streptomyces TaxID=1883 RepID=UPI0020C6D550|nr:MFS transporter [Streptomyces sp. GbtcB7]
MIACDLVAGAALLSVPAAAWLDALTLQHLVVVALICGTAAVCFNTAYHSYIPIVLDGRNLLEGNAKLQGSEAAVQVAGLLADAVTFLISVGCLKRMRVVEPEHAPGEERPPLRRQIVEGLRFVGRDPYLRPMVTWGAAISMALMGYQAVQVVFLVRTVGLNPAMVGLLLTSGSAGGIVGALLANGFSRRFGTARGLLLLQGATAPFALLMPMTTAGPELLLFATGGFFVGIGISVANIVVGSFRQTYCPWARARRMCVHPCRPADRRPRRRGPDAESYEPFARTSRWSRSHRTGCWSRSSRRRGTACGPGSTASSPTSCATRAAPPADRHLRRVACRSQWRQVCGTSLTNTIPSLSAKWAGSSGE